MTRIRHLSIRKYLATLKYIYKNFIANESIYPFYCSFKVVQRCDCRCKFCNVWKMPMPDMPTEKVLRIINNIANSSILLLSIEGGEPLLRKDIGEILKYIRTKSLFVLFTTSGKLFDRRPMEEYSKYIDFLHISIDEGHENLELFDRLPEFVKWGPVVCVQIVVMREYLNELEQKIRKCQTAGAKALVMPACHIPQTENFLPDLQKFRRETFRLKKKYPHTIITTDKYLNTLDVLHSCSTTSIIIDADGMLYYPCRTLMEKSIDISKHSLLEFLNSVEAQKCREKMYSCKRNCHWYQYFATDSFVSLKTGFSALEPYVGHIL